MKCFVVEGSLSPIRRKCRGYRTKKKFNDIVPFSMKKFSIPNKCRSERRKSVMHLDYAVFETYHNDAR